jgi:hypothetical protein
MNWTKLGKIFDPTEHVLPNGCTQFAQSPQPLVFNDFVRIYFSTRIIDPACGRHLSHIAFVDMDKALDRIIRVSDRTVISLGARGCFDEHGIFPMNVLRHRGVIYGYTCGWSRRVSVSVETAIGLAISHDEGVTFERIGDGPVMSASLHEPCLVGDGFVKVINDTFHIWYIFGIGWRRYAEGATPDRTYKIGHAVSEDGINWQREDGRQIIADRLGPDESQALPSIVEIGGRYHMFFCYRESFDFRTTKGRGYRLSYAWSDDLHTWARDDEWIRLDFREGEWDRDMQCYPHAFACDGKIYLLYNGNEFGRHGFGAAILEA